MKKIKPGTGYLGTHVSEETKNYFYRLKEEKGIPIAQLFLLGLAKALSEIDPDTDPNSIPEIQRLKNHAQLWSALKGD